ncbi:MAG: DUF2158 domain-containing protein [Cyclobacteriaceae bacterium]
MERIERKFKKGDLVMLKSGGPEMTVNGYAWHGNYQSFDTIVCHWFDGKEHRQSEFDQDAVRLVD